MAHGSALPDWSTARRLAWESVPESAGMQDLPISEACDRVLARDHRARTDLPPYDTSAMDGWAVRGPGPWRIIGKVLAGSADLPDLSDGEATVIATGALIPPDALGVVRRERGTTQGAPGAETLRAETPQPGREVRPAGAECRSGDVLGAVGAWLNPALLGLLAAAGHDRLAVRPRPRAAVLVLGDELLDQGLPRDGRVRDSLGPQLPGWLQRLGARPLRPRRVADTLDEHVCALRGALDEADVILTSGGTAAGPVDHLHDALTVLGGELVVDSVACRPGHPMLLARIQHRDRPRWLIGLPGNPQSAVVALMTLGQPVIDHLLGRDLSDPQAIRSADTVTAPARENRLVPGRIRSGSFHVADHLGSAMLRGLAGAAGLAVLPPAGVESGDPVGWLPFP